MTVREKIQISTLCRENECLIIGKDKNKFTGVAIEFGTEFGVDALAVYSDLKGAWYSGKDSSLVEFDLSGHPHSVCQQLRVAVNRGVQHAIPHPTQVPSTPPPGYIVISFLSIYGIAYALGASRDMASDGIAGPIIHAGLIIRKMILGVD